MRYEANGLSISENFRRPLRLLVHEDQLITKKNDQLGAVSNELGGELSLILPSTLRRSVFNWIPSPVIQVHKQGVREGPRLLPKSRGSVDVE